MNSSKRQIPRIWMQLVYWKWVEALRWWGTETGKGRQSRSIEFSPLWEIVWGTSRKAIWRQSECCDHDWCVGEWSALPLSTAGNVEHSQLKSSDNVCFSITWHFRQINVFFIIRSRHVHLKMLKYVRQVKMTIYFEFDNLVAVFTSFRGPIFSLCVLVKVNFTLYF